MASGARTYVMPAVACAPRAEASALTSQLTSRHSARMHAGSDVCVLLVEAGPVAPWAPGGDPGSTIRIVRCTFIGKFELRVADKRTRLVMENCTVLENGTLNVHVANGAQVDLAQVHFGERSSGITVTGRGSRCNMHDCSIGLAEDATITVRHGLALQSAVSVTPCAARTPNTRFAVLRCAAPRRGMGCLNTGRPLNSSQLPGWRGARSCLNLRSTTCVHACTYGRIQPLHRQRLQ